MKLKKYKSIFATLAALMLLATACTKIDEDADNICNSATGTTVSVTIPIGIAEQETTAPASRTAAMPASSRTTAATAPAPAAATTAKLTPSPQEGFTVSFGEPTPTTTTDAPDANAAPSTRTVAEKLFNVWVLQFDSSGKNVSTTRVNEIEAGTYLTVPSLNVGDGYTIYIIANGPISGLSIIKPKTLTDFETLVNNAPAITNGNTLTGKLTGVSVTDLGDGKGKISLADATMPVVVLRRIYAEIKLTVDFSVSGYSQSVNDVMLYNVPKAPIYGWNDATIKFPTADAGNFNYTSTAIAGMKPSIAPSYEGGTKNSYTWFIGDNRRGDVAGITAQTDRYSGKAPAYATFARITAINKTNSAIKIYYDIYLGSGDVKNFDVKRNHTYNVTVAIKGTANFQEALVNDDNRVSGVNTPIFLTDNSAHSPIVISPKIMESTSATGWGPNVATNATDASDGKGNTNKIIALGNASQYPAAYHCYGNGSQWYLPANNQLKLMSIYLSAIPATDRPAELDFWSSSETSSSNAWFVHLSKGFTVVQNKDYNNNISYRVRCVRDGANPTYGLWKYPRVEGGNTIVSRDAAGGIKSDALLTTAEKNWLNSTNTSTTHYLETSHYNKVSPKFQVASTDLTSNTMWPDAYTFCKNYSTGAPAGSWRLPTQRELILIYILLDKLTGCATIQDTTKESFWSSTKVTAGFTIASTAWYAHLLRGQTLTGNADGLSYNDKYVRCVRDL